MTEALVWKHVTEPQAQLLATRHDLNDCRRRQVFTAAQTSAFLGICQALIESDFSKQSVTTLSQSFQHFQKLLLTHSVNRSPKSVCVFSPSEVEAIVDFVTHSYYRHFQLYKMIYTSYYRLHFVQTAPNDVQVPKAPRPLADALMHVAPERPSTSADQSKEP